MTALLELDAVSRSFGKVVVADSVSLEVAAGETVGVVGPNGAGKTSLLNLISGNLSADAGRIRLAGRDITGDPAHVRARLGVGRTYQVPLPFGGMTVFENTLLGASYAGARRGSGHEASARAVAALDRTGLLPLANCLASTLPLLDRKQLELARALAIQPRLLLLDEIAGGLAEHEVVDLVETIRRLRSEGVTIIWIEHVVPALMAVVDRLIATSRGRVLMDGDPAAVMADPVVHAEYLGAEVVA